jgi:hypothetical protein
MGLSNPVPRDRKEDVGSGGPSFHLGRDANFGDSAGNRFESGVAGRDVIPQRADGPNQSVKQIQSDRDPNVYSGVQGRGRQVQHYGDDKPKECNQMLKHKKLITETPDGGESADVQPAQENVRS